MEEFVGKVWHRYITRVADQRFPDAAVSLEEMRRTAAIFFRALGGEGGLRIEQALETESGARRSLLQRIAGTGRKTELAWRDEETLRLPDTIALFPSHQLNRDLYLWLTALSATEVDSRPNDWLEVNRQRTVATLRAWPGLEPRYRELVAAHLDLRPSPDELPEGESHQETVIRRALLFPDRPCRFEQAARTAPGPVPLWLHPAPPVSGSPASQANHPGNEPADLERSRQQHARQHKRKQAERADAPEKEGGLMSFRLESLWSWTEFVKLDRSSTEEDDDDLGKTAEDMDRISLARDNQTTSARIRLDIDLPAEAYDDIVLGEGIPIDEWDYRQQRMLRGHCRIQEMISRHAETSDLPPSLRSAAHRVRRQFEVLRPQRTWVNRQNDGSEFDMENYINFLADRKHGRVANDTPVYRAMRDTHRDLACLLLADLSLSTDAYVNNESRVIDVIRDAMFLFAEALDTTGDRFALHGFSSRNRDHVRFYNIKRFDETYNAEIRGRIDVIKPGYFTRMGTAIRHATALLSAQASSRKLLLILTDGKPNDLDRYEGRHGIEDTREAVLEAERMGLRPFCVTIDEHAADYLPYLFGKRAYVLIHNAEELPRKLPALYLRLTQ